MPIPAAAVGPIMSAGAGIIDSAVNFFGQQGLNKKNRQWQEDMWNKTNAYNSPVMQMQRFKEAGLNPHLIYGQGNSGNASMASSPDTKAPEVNFADATMNYVAYKKQQNEINNLEKALEVMEADKINKGASTTNLLATAARTTQEREQAEKLFSTVYAQAEMNLSNSTLQNTKISAEIDNILQNTSMSKTQQDAARHTITKTLQEIQNLKADKRNKEADTRLKNLEIQLRKMGINPNDPAWLRIPVQYFSENPISDIPNKIGGGIKKMGTAIKNWFTK